VHLALANLAEVCSLSNCYCLQRPIETALVSEITYNVSSGTLNPIYHTIPYRPRQLRTQYVEVICSKSATLKSRLRITQTQRRWEWYRVLPYFIFCGLLSETSSVAAEFSRHGMPPTASNLDLWSFDLETGMRVASKVRNLPSNFGHARPLCSGIIRYVRETDGQTDRRTDKSNAYCPLPYSRIIINLDGWMNKGV